MQLLPIPPSPPRAHMTDPRQLETPPTRSLFLFSRCVFIGTLSFVSVFKLTWMGTFCHASLFINFVNFSSLEAELTGRECQLLFLSTDTSNNASVRLGVPDDSTASVSITKTPLF